MAPFITFSAHWSLFEFSQQRHGMLMNDDDIILHDKLLSIQKYLMLVLCFVLILYII